LKRILLTAGFLALAGCCGYFVLTAPALWSLVHPQRDVADAGPADLARGHALFFAGSCGTCHATPGQRDATRLGGGLALVSGFGTFYMPNISSDVQDGIGAWTTAEFTRAMREGVSRAGANEYPAFPYTSFQRMTANDLRDLFGYIKTLSPVTGKARDHDLAFPFTMRRGVGLWRLVFLDGEPLPAAPDKSEAWLRGRYLVEGAGHCAECHSPRNVAGAIEAGKRYSGAPDPEGQGYVPNITPAEAGIGYWSVREIADYLDNGVSPIGLAAGGSMAAVIANLGKLTPEDRAGMAEYLKTIPGVEALNQGVPPPNHTQVVRMLPAILKVTRSPTTALSAAPGNATTLYAVAIKPLFLSKPDAAQSAGVGEGRLLPAAKLDVVAQDGNWLQVRVDGWRQSRSDSAIYALQGQRILVAVLDPALAAKIDSGPATFDAATNLTWSKASLTGWVDKADLTADLPAIWTYSSDLYNASCGSCHALHTADAYLANQWIGNLAAMKRFTSLDDGQYRLLQAYLQFHSKDVDASPSGRSL
jgi:mono/diheme cytochrome c family protein